MRHVNIDQTKFSILQCSDKYRIQKMCSVTNKLYFVFLTQEQLFSYYTNKGKNVSNLEGFTKEEKLFLETTCTPAEVESLSPVFKKMDKKRWRYQLGHKDK